MAPLVVPNELDGYPGAPFSQAVVDSAIGAIRRYCEWTIGPVTTETFTLDSRGGTVLLLPTMHLTGVTEVRDLSGDTPVVLDGWRKSKAGMLERLTGWPRGFETVAVDAVHGYEACPDELLPIIAQACQRSLGKSTITERSIDDYAVKYKIQDVVDPYHLNTLKKFKLQEGV